jgi:hypothetical protein
LHSFGVSKMVPNREMTGCFRKYLPIYNIFF